MSEDRLDREQELFDAALEVAAGERSAFLTEACGGDEELRSRVERLIRWADRDTADAGLDAPDPVTLDEQPGTAFGPYQIVELIGEGGFGAVYRAEQERPVRRTVALKIIKLGMDTKQVIARFEAERQALAMMDHPHIARVFEAGATDKGRPYFVMELVQGVPVTEYCDRHQLGLEARLGLFMLVCDAVQHAHQKGIIHRDLKPSNVLVTENGRPLPKVIDFGIAKATSAKLTERTLFTVSGQLVGTPAYMSPEQADSAGTDIDTRSDIYSLGVLLYELLTGTTPFDAQTFERLAYPEIQKIIVEQEPPTPSTRASGLGEDLVEVARHRNVEPTSLPRLLRGDLDWIVMRALEKDRTRRYGTASDLAGDISRYLRNEPVTASPPGAAYRMRKFVRRHRIGVAAGAVLALALLIGFGGLSWGLARALRAEAEARADEETATNVSAILAGLFDAPSPRDGGVITVRSVLDDGAQRITNQRSLEPLVRARLMMIIGGTYSNLRQLKEARGLQEEALAIFRAERGDDHRDVASALTQLGMTMYRSGDGAASIRLFEESARIYTKVHGPDHPLVGAVESLIAERLLTTGDFERAKRLHEHAIEVLEGYDNNHRYALALNRYGELLYNLGDYNGAVEMQERALPILEGIHGPDHGAITFVLTDLAIVLIAAGDFEAARPLLERNLAIREKVFGPDHDLTAWALKSLGKLLTRTGDYKEAQALLERSIATFDRGEHNSVAYAINDYGPLLIKMGEFERAREVLERGRRIIEESFVPGDPELAITLHGLAVLHRELGEYDQAEPLFEEALRIREAVFDPDNPLIAVLLHDQAILYYDLGRFDEAETLLKRALTIREAKLPPDHPDTVETLAELDRLQHEGVLGQSRRR